MTDFLLLITLLERKNLPPTAEIPRKTTFAFNKRSVYSQLMAKLLRLPKYLQMEIEKALIVNVSKGFEKDK